MGNKATTLRLTMAALLGGALILPGLASAHDRDDGRGWEGRGDWHHEHHHRGWHHGHWRGPDERVVVVREPTYVAPAPTVVAPAWGPPGLSISLVVPGRW